MLFSIGNTSCALVRRSGWDLFSLCCRPPFSSLHDWWHHEYAKLHLYEGCSLRYLARRFLHSMDGKTTPTGRVVTLVISVAKSAKQLSNATEKRDVKSISRFRLWPATEITLRAGQYHHSRLSAEHHVRVSIITPGLARSTTCGSVSSLQA